MRHGERWAAQLRPFAGPVIVAALLVGACACEGTPESNSNAALCDYYAEWLDIAYQLAPPQEASFDALLASGDLREIEEQAGAGYERLERFLDGFDNLAAPPEARVWHASVEDTATALQGFFLMLESAAGQGDAHAVATVLDRLQFGLLVEVDQLGRQGESLFRPCLGR